MHTNTIRQRLVRALLAAGVGALFVASSLPLAAQTTFGEITGHKVPVPGERVEGTTAKLSEVEAELVARMKPQGQAERLLQYAISHHIGATDDIKVRVKAGAGRSRSRPRWKRCSMSPETATTCASAPRRSKSSWPP